MKSKDPIVGTTIGFLKVITRKPDRTTGSPATRARCLVQCVCGKRFIATRQNLTRKEYPLSHCGCKKPEKTFKQIEYTTWNNMVVRCHDEDHVSYAAYGAKGVRVCDRWLPIPYGTLTREEAFANFYADLGDRPSDHPKYGPYSIDRKDATGGYNPGNVRWAHQFDQARNKRGTKWVTDPRDRTRRVKAAVLAEELNMRYQAMREWLLSLGLWE